MLPSGTVLGTRVQKGHKGAFFLGERHYTESKSLLSVTRKIDIIADPKFIQVNKMFKGVTRVNKSEGRGETQSIPLIEPKD